MANSINGDDEYSLIEQSFKNIIFKVIVTLFIKAFKKVYKLSSEFKNWHSYS